MRPKRPSVKLCPKCGELVGDDELFCSNCGYRM
ncbi:MAG: zinc-ribbon domain-containing protein [Ruminococcus sp.]|nr:zinc-ribbon domain-containing protein [Ruminococcus sp.]